MRFVLVVNGDKTRTLTVESFHETYAQAYADADLLLRKIAVKALRQKLQTQLHWYVVPTPYQGKTQVGFLEFMPISNMFSEGSGGVYALRCK